MRILTSRLQATNTKGTRIRATILGERDRSHYPVRSVTLGYDYALGFGENHAAAAAELLRRNDVSRYLSEKHVGVYCDEKGERMAWDYAHACFTTSKLPGETVVSITRAAY